MDCEQNCLSIFLMKKVNLLFVYCYLNLYNKISLNNKNIKNFQASKEEKLSHPKKCK